MINAFSAIYDFLIISIMGGAILLFASEIKLESLKKASQGSTKLSKYSERMTGTKLDLSDERVYGKVSKY